MLTTAPPRLTELAHGGGCGCKLSPAVLRQIMGGMPATAMFANLMVGTETSDDAAVWRLSDSQALVATTDFFMPVVDDPRDFGRIAAANALSDIYAMGARPIMALAIVGMPIDKLSSETIAAVLAGGAEVCAAAGIPVAGGHSIDSVEPIYGLVALGLVHPDHLMKNSKARVGDALILTKPLGVGVLSAAFKQGRLDAAGYETLIASTTQLNTLGMHLIEIDGVHAVTDVTGFGLLGHTLEMARGATLEARIVAADTPLLPGAEALAREGIRTGAAQRNWVSYGAEIEISEAMAEWRRNILADPQTSGGLLIAVAEPQAEAVLRMAREMGFHQAAQVGWMVEGAPLVTVL